MEGFVKGTCMTMCPEEEILMREREGLLHCLEIEDPSIKTRRPKPRKEFMVKSYQRSAAGKSICQPHLVRPPPVLQQVIHFLLDRVVRDERLPFFSIYEYISDRLRAVRQDIIVQQPPASVCIPLLEPMVRFYSYSAYRLCEAPLNKFDPKLNHNHLLECIKWLLNLYDSIEHKSEDRIEMEAIYILLNLGDYHPLLRSTLLDKSIRMGLLLEAERMSLSWCFGNYYAVCRKIQNLPPLLSAIVIASHLPHIRKYALQVMNTAYSSKNLTYPLSNLKDLLLYGSLDEVLKDCRSCGLSADDDKVQFRKGEIKDYKMGAKKILNVDKKLCEVPVSEILLQSRIL